MKTEWQSIAPGVFRAVFGTPENVTPTTQPYFSMPDPAIFETAGLPGAAPLFDAARVSFLAGPRGCRLTLPKHAEEAIYGFGLQLQSLEQTGKKRVLRVNSDPVADTGDSHAPVPVYFSTAGYGIFFDTARYLNCYTGGNEFVRPRNASTLHADAKIALTESELYQGSAAEAPVVAEIPAAQGVAVYYFAGPTLAAAVARYNLFSGGGCAMPAWALGIQYRLCGTADETHARNFAKELRRKHIPCDVLGLEPGWQSHAYSCTLDWAKNRFPAPDDMLDELHKEHFHTSLWEHMFIHQDSPIYEPELPYAGEFEVWQGLVPDFRMEKARRIFADYHARHLIEPGADAFKLDECDNSDFIHSPWSFPECAEFPSGCDGEVMHSLLGMLYQHTILEAFRQAGRRTGGNVRNSHALAAPMPFFLYSDLYEHRQFIRGVTTCGFGGLLWTPELRHAKNELDYLRRLQTMILAPQFLMNIWMMPHPPWMQLVREKNVAGEFYPAEIQQRLENLTRDAMQLRMAFIPYLLAAFAAYRFEGRPPFRALAMDDPSNEALRSCDRAWFAGEELIAAPLTCDETQLDLPLPPGIWYDFYTGERFEDHVLLTPQPERLPILVRENSTIPMAEDPGEYVDPTRKTLLQLRTYGAAPRPAKLYRDDPDALDYNGAARGEVAADGTLSAGMEAFFEIAGIRRF